MSQVTTATRPAFVEAHPELCAAHRDAQKAMFGAARAAGLSYSRDLQLRGMNEALGLRGSARITSRRELTITEMRAVTVAIEGGMFSDDWTWGQDFSISIRTRTVEIEEVHFEPRAGRFERMAAMCQSAPDWLTRLVSAN